MTTAPNGNPIIRVGSHRANEKLIDLIGETQGWFSFYHPGSFKECPQDRLKEALRITGIYYTGIDINKLQRCWAVSLATESYGNE